MGAKFQLSLIIGCFLLAQPSLAATCPKPQLVQKAIALQHGKASIDDDPIGGGIAAKQQRKAGIDDDPIGGGVTAKQQPKTGIDDDPIGGGISSDPEWKTAEAVARAFDIFGDGSTYVVLQGVKIDDNGGLTCVYGFSEASGLGFMADRASPAAYITLKRGVCRTASGGWRQQRIGDNKKTGEVVSLCNASEAACNFNCR